MPNVCDFSSARPNFAALKAAGYSGVITYATRFGLNAALYQQILAAGLQFAMVMEWGTQPGLRGAPGGTADAQAAEATAKAIGYGGAIYYVAEDPNTLSTASWPTVVSYFQAVKAVNPNRALGAYGSQALVAHLQQLGLVKYGWCVDPWSPTRAGMHLTQILGSVPAAFVGQIDTDLIIEADWGQVPQAITPSGAGDNDVRVIEDANKTFIGLDGPLSVTPLTAAEVPWANAAYGPTVTGMPNTLIDRINAQVAADLGASFANVTNEIAALSAAVSGLATLVQTISTAVAAIPTTVPATTPVSLKGETATITFS